MTVNHSLTVGKIILTTINKINAHLKIISRAVLYCSLCWFCSFQASAQQSSDIWVGKLNFWEKDPITELVKITDTDSYTNQPYFFDNTRLYYTQAMSVENGDSQMDVWMFDMMLGLKKNITDSPTSEYSPTPLPNNKGMSVIRVNDLGKQELWELSLQGKAIKNIAPEIEPVGYQVWINEKELLLFVLGEPNILQRVNVDAVNSKAQTIDSTIGASLYRYTKTNWFLYTSTADGNYLNAYNSKTDKVIQVVKLPKNSAYFAVGPLGNIVTSDGTTLWHSKLMLKGEKVKTTENWQPIKINQVECATGISRTAISPDASMIAMVCPRA